MKFGRLTQIEELLPEFEVWGAATGHYSFVITKERDEYRCSWKNRVLSMPKTHYMKEVFRSKEAAERACSTQLARLLGYLA